MEDIMISVCCLAYNHGKYIRDCMEGFVHQKTSYKYEVVVHDDASTDNTADIIKEYAEHYPDIIKPIFQTENQYSKCISISRNFIFPKIKGKYIAVCEGDDYWCDEYKLQKQIEFLEKHPDYVACVHNTKVINCRTGEEYFKIKNAIDETLSTEQVLNNSVKEFHTSSIVFRREYMIIPLELSLSYCGDYPRALYLALNGKIFRYGNVMSVYRFFSHGSYTERTESAKKEIIISRQKESIQVHKNFDKYSNFQYHDIFQKKIDESKFNILWLSGEKKKAIKKYPHIVSNTQGKDRVRLYLDAYLPILLKIYRGLRDGR